MAGMFNVIVLCGPQQVGKTTAARSLTKYWGFTQLSFAEPIYEMIAALLGMTVADVRLLPKDAPLPGLANRTLRHALQTLGTEWGRNMMGERIWIDAAILRIQNALLRSQRVVVDDCRFRNEYDAIRSIGARVVRLRRASLPEQQDKHDSEQEWPNFPAFDAVISNATPAPDEWELKAGGLILEAVSRAS